MVASTIVILASPKTRTKGGGNHVLLFFIDAFPFEIWSQTLGVSMHGEINEYDHFKNMIQMIVKINEIVQFTKATPGSSLVVHKLM